MTGRTAPVESHHDGSQRLNGSCSPSWRRLDAAAHNLLPVPDSYARSLGARRPAGARVGWLRPVWTGRDRIGPARRWSSRLPD